MAAFGHEPATPVIGQPEVWQRNARYGMILFIIYLALYGAFVLVNALRPEWMDVLVFGGVNLAVAYGLGLIVAAFGLALYYGWLCRSSELAPMEGPK